MVGGSAEAPAHVVQKVEALLPGLIGDLKQLSAIPSIAFPGFPPENVIEAHDFVVGLLADVGVEKISSIDLPDTSPIIFAEVDGPPVAPTVLLYAHYDVQPPGDESLWAHEPFEPVEMDGVLYARGVADDKSNLMAHIGMLRYFDGKPPVNLKIVFEGQEEYGSPFDYYPPSDPERFACDAMVIADMGNIRPGVPTFTTALRGDAEVVVEVRTLPEPKHSGEYGGPAPDALITLIHALSTLHDEQGNPAVEGLLRDSWAGATPIDEPRFREMAGLPPDSPLLGEGTIADRLWSGPALTVVGLDAPATEGAVLAVVPHAKALINIRVHPLQRAKDAQQAVVDHFRAIRPFGIELTAEPVEAGDGFQTTTDGFAYAAAREALREAWGVEPIEIGSGGAIPLVSGLQEAVPGAEILLFGAEDMLCNLHAPNERLVIDEFRRTVIAMVRFMETFASGDAAPSMSQ
jgi:acetylornithine deacetylase/succinyl-diaminopimelate desuccinylase-like protein